MPIPLSCSQESCPSSRTCSISLIMSARMTFGLDCGGVDALVRDRIFPMEEIAATAIFVPPTSMPIKNFCFMGRLYIKSSFQLIKKIFLFKDNARCYKEVLLKTHIIILAFNLIKRRMYENC